MISRSTTKSTASFRRKIVRDLTGRTGIKTLQAVWRRGRESILELPGSGNLLVSQLVVNGLMFGALYLAGHPALYLMWPAAFMTFHMLIVRVRQVAEHGAVPDPYDPDPRKNTRTTYARLWERPFVAPFHLNYHLEHHFVATVPCYRLESFHRFLLSKGFYEGVDFPRSYFDLFTRVVIKREAPTAS